MAEGSNKRRRKGNISQEDIYPVLQRYSITTVVTLLKEVSQVADEKFDWNELVSKTATGVSSAREYQMLWRHLAYRDTLEEKIDEGDVPMDDDSDIEFELEAYPPFSSDASTEAVACVKVLIASGSLVDGNPSSAVEAPLSIRIPSGWSSNSASEKLQLQETNITIPVLIPKQPMSMPTVASVEGLDAMEAAGGNLPPRRRRKPWSKEEDEELIAAVQRNGEGNWANILKGEFKSDRTPSQLSHRWAIIKKQKKSSNVGAGSLTADFSAVRKAFNMALDMPMVDSKSVLLNGKGGTSNPNSITTPSNSSRPTAGESSQSQYHLQQDSEPTTSSISRFMNSVKPSSSPSLSPDAMVKAAAFAAGARIATPSDAASLLKAAQSKNAVRIIPSGSNPIKSSGPSNLNSLPPNVHFFGRGPVNRSTSGHNNVMTNAARPGTPQTQTQGQITRPSPPTTQNNLVQTANETNSSREKVHGEINVVSRNLPTRQISKSVADASCSEPNKSISDHASVLQNEVKEKVQEDQSALPRPETNLERENNNVENPRCLSPSKVAGKSDLTGLGVKSVSEKLEENKKIDIQVEKERENKSASEEKGSEMAEEDK